MTSSEDARTNHPMQGAPLLRGTESPSGRGSKSWVPAVVAALAATAAGVLGAQLASTKADLQEARAVQDEAQQQLAVAQASAEALGSELDVVTDELTDAESELEEARGAFPADCDVDAVIAAADAVAADGLRVREAAGEYPAVVLAAAEGGAAGDLSGVLDRMRALSARLTDQQGLTVAEQYGAARAACDSP